MPSVFQGSPGTIDLHGLAKAKRSDISYNYPNGLDLEPGSETHDRLKTYLFQLALNSSNEMSKRHDTWNEINRVMTGHIDLSAEEKKVKNADDRDPVAIVVPQQYATMQTLLTYMLAAFGDKLFRYEGVSPEDVGSAILLEHHINYQAEFMTMLLNFHTMWQDAFKYGFGVMFPAFVTKRRPTRKVTRVLGPDLFSSTDNPLTVESEEGGDIIYQGNTLTNGDVFRIFPDINYQLHDIENQEYFGWMTRKTYLNLLDEEVESEGDVFNVKYLEFITGESQLSRDSGSERGKKTDLRENDLDTIYAKSMDILNIFVSLIPSNLGLGDGKEREDWLFRIAGDQIIIEAGPIGLDHGRKPAVACAPDFDGHSISPVSRMELDYPMQNAINWMFNSHMTEVRKFINNTLVIDPGLADFQDASDTRNGGLIRMRRSAWGLGRTKDAITQLPVSDVTRNHMVDIQLFKGLSDDVTGAQLNLGGGISSKKERVSSAETRLAGRGALSRLEKDARVIFYQAHHPLSMMMASHTIQLMDTAQWVAVSGEIPDNIRKELNIEDGRALLDPSDLRDLQLIVQPNDGSIPGLNDDPQSLVQLTQAIMSTQNPQIIQGFDFLAMLRSIARRLNIKEVDRWIRDTPIQTQVTDAETIQNGVQAGNLVPVNGGL